MMKTKQEIERMIKNRLNWLGKTGWIIVDVNVDVGLGFNVIILPDHGQQWDFVLPCAPWDSEETIASAFDAALREFEASP